MVKEVVKRPILTEKATLQAEKRIYSFEVIPSANKIEIARSIKARFGVEVDKVQTSWIKAKRKVQMTKKGLMRGEKGRRKKAIVHLKPGFEIDLFAPIDTKDKGII